MQAPSLDGESAELARFREEWKAEVRRNKKTSVLTAATTSTSKVELPVPPSHQWSNVRVASSSSAPLHIPPELLTAPKVNDALSSAVQVYRDAITFETQGDLVEDLTTAMSKTTVAIGSAGKVTGHVAQIVAEFPPDLDFLPEDEKLPVFLRRLPEELILHVLGVMSATLLARFALVCRRACVLTLDSGIWRDLVSATYKPPQVSSIDDMTPVLERCKFDYRRVYIEQPRVRVDGLYVAVCHYVRPGLSDNHWVNVTHLITYNRYLRFFPDGRVLSLLVNEEYKPQQIVPLLKYHSRMKGLLVGEWSLDAESSTVQLTKLIDSQSILEHHGSVPDHSIPAALQVHDLAVPKAKRHDGVGGTLHPPNVAPTPTRYVFSMALSLKSKPLGRWNRLDIVDYSTVNVETGDIQPVALKQERPFWFSKVKSYA